METQNATEDVVMRKIRNSGENQSPTLCHTGLWRNGSIAPLNLKFGTIWRCVVNVFFGRFMSGESSLGSHQAKPREVLRGFVDLFL
jgi:hypothetical protein